MNLRTITPKWVTIALITLFSINSYAFKSNEREIESVIKHLSPHLTQNEASKYAIIIKKYSEKYDIDWVIPVAIFKQESDFVLNTVNYKTNDIGMGQLNWYWHVKKKRLDLKKLLTDADYAIHETYKILYSLKRRYNTGSTGWRRWFTRYHSFRPSDRKRYHDRELARWFVKMERYINGKKENDEQKTYAKRSRSSKRNVSPRDVEERNKRLNRAIAYYSRKMERGR